VRRRSAFLLALGILLPAFAGCLNGHVHGDRQDDFVELLEGHGTIRATRNMVELTGTWHLEHADFNDPLLSIHLVEGNLTIKQSNLRWAHLVVGEFRQSGHLLAESSTLIGAISISNGTAIMRDSRLTTETPGLGGVMVSADDDEAGLSLRNSTISPLASLRARFVDPPVGRIEGMAGEFQVSTKTPVDLSELEMDVKGLGIQFEMTNALLEGPRPLPQKFPLGRLHGTVDHFKVGVNKGQAIVLDTDSYDLRTRQGDMTPPEVGGWIEFTGKTPTPYSLCIHCPHLEFMPHTLFGPPEAVTCQPPGHAAQGGRLLRLVGHGHWLTVDWELPASQTAGYFALQLIASLPNGQTFVALDGFTAWNYVSEFQVPLLSGLCLDDSGTPTQAVAYDVKLWVGSGAAGAGGCARIEPGATSVSVVPHFYGRREDEGAFMGLPCPVSPLPPM
jgi:hypothetical protein